MSLDLFDAIERHDLSRLASLLSAGADPNADHPDQPSWVPLKAAAEDGVLGAVVLLLRHGADADGGRQPGGTTPLIVATLNSRVEVAQLLLAAGADPSTCDDEGDTPLSLCIGQGDHATAELLRLCGAGAEPDRG
ncbi:ankyrin repeat domain-containing protein [Fimbriiglobus ruber]|uniref:Ankyrin repeat protein n=1 Tax=Fimbriiglobus ruber TaxID=1908690 RepID=A0A225DM10_9BACT|nr:ankyrin repeat domain-containing protein [Fimbriiglobus ruber]OWK38516.1 Ankyrin repeat protein [Fimbriiglobus ruber]